MLSKNFKSFGSLTLIFFFIISVIFYDVIFTHIFEWSLKKYTLANFGHPLQCEKIEYKNLKWKLYKPFTENGSKFQAEEMTFSFTVNLWERKIHVHLLVDRPQWCFQSNFACQQEKLEKLASQSGKWFQVIPSIEIQSGKITSIHPDHLNMRIFFDFIMNQHDGIIFNMNFDPSKTINAPLIVLANNSDHLKASFFFNDLSCSSLIELGKFLNLTQFSWKCLSGKINGEIQGIFTKEKKRFLEGEIQLDDLHIIADENRFEGFMENVLVKISKTPFLNQTVGEITLNKPTSFFYESIQDLQNWNMQDVLGSIALNEKSMIDFHLKGKSEEKNDHLDWNLAGLAKINSRQALNMTFDLACCNGSEDTEGRVHFQLSPYEDKMIADLNIFQFSHQKINFLQNMLGVYFPALHQVQFENGNADVTLRAILNKKEICKVDLLKCQIDDLIVSIAPWKARAAFDQIEGHGSIYLTDENIWNSLEAELHVENGEMNWGEVESLLPLKGIQAQLLFQKGKLEHSLMTLQLGKLNGILDFEWGHEKKLCTFELKGEVGELSEILPKQFQNSVRKNFKDKSMVILANLEQHPDDFELKGTVHIPGETSDQMDLIHFGCKWKKIDEILHSTYRHRGRFFTHKLPIDPYIAPFIFRDGIVEMTGFVDLEGEFDENFLNVKYNAYQVKLENEHFSMKALELRSPQSGGYAGFHQVDLKNKTHIGELPIYEATYHEKNTGLIFKNIKGQMEVKDQFLQLKELESDCENVHFGGNITMDYADPSPGVFSLSIECPVFLGKVSEIQKLLAGMKQDSFLQNVPLEGECIGSQEGIRLHFDFFPKKHDLFATFKGQLKNGTLKLDESNPLINEISTEIAYDHSQDSLTFSNLQGVIHVGKTPQFEEYELLGEFIRVRNLEDPEIELNLSVIDQEKELGKIVASSTKQANGLHQVNINTELSHVSSFYFKTWECIVKDWTSLVALKAESYFDVNQLLRDLYRFQRTGILGVSSELIQRIKHLDRTEGEAQLALAYEPKDFSFYYDLSCNPLNKNNQIHQLFVKGKYFNKKWMIDHFQWDQWIAYAEFEKKEKNWKIPFLGLKFENILLLGLAGEYFSDRDFLDAQLNFCSIDFEKLANWDPFQFLNFDDLKGILEAKGKIEWDFSLPAFQNGLKANLKMEAKGFFVKNQFINFSNPFQMDIQEGKKVFFKELDFTIFSPNHDLSQFQIQEMELSLGKENYQFSILSRIERTPFQVVGQIERLSQNKGNLKLIDLSASSRMDYRPLEVEWDKKWINGFSLKSLQGEFSGCYFNFHRNEQELNQNNPPSLSGEVIVQPNLLTFSLPQEFSEKIQQLKLNAPFTLMGRAWFDFRMGASLLKILFFQGQLAAYPFVFKGYRFEQLKGNVYYQPNYLFIDQFVVEDRAGVLLVPQFRLEKKKFDFQENWIFQLPELQIKDAKPALLESLDQDKENVKANPKFRSLVFKKIMMSKIYGDLEKTETWQGEGFLQFLNAKKNNTHPLLTIPAEIILRLGLDPNIFNPVTGTILFKLSGDRFYLTRFKDVFSEGRGSKFYLSDGDQSWIDFGGNISVKFRMKHYNLIFKLSEFFTISVDGSIGKPRYTLNKQAKDNPRRTNRKKIMTEKFLVSRE